MKNEIPFISIGTIFERLFIKGIIFRIVQEIISDEEMNHCFTFGFTDDHIRTICFSKM